MRPPTPADSGGSTFGNPAISGSVRGNSILGKPVVSGSTSGSHTMAGSTPGGHTISRPAFASGVLPAHAPAFLGAPTAEALAVQPDQSRRIADAGLASGGCFVRPLPIDTTCASAARRFFREALSSLPIPAGLLHDGVTMASELAANTLHAYRNVALSAARQRAAAGVPEIWVYLRGSGRTCELVCKVFDAERSWTAGAEPGMSDAPLDSVNGRGLQVVAGLSAGQWGCHLTRSRLGSWKVPGKVVWFALRIPAAVLPDHFGRPRYHPDWLVDELEMMLADRGLSAGILRADREGTSVLSISQHLTVWRHGGTVSWRLPSGDYQQIDLADIIEVAEQIVCAHEESILGGIPVS